MDTLFVKTFGFYLLLDPTVLRSWCTRKVVLRSDVDGSSGSFAASSDGMPFLKNRYS